MSWLPKALRVAGKTVGDSLGMTAVTTAIAHISHPFPEPSGMPCSPARECQYLNELDKDPGMVKVG